RGLKVTGSDYSPIGGNAFPCLCGGIVISIGSLRAAAGQRQAIDAAGSLNARDFSRFVEELFREAVCVFEFWITDARDIELQCERVTRFVAGLRLFEQEEAANQ